MDNNVNKNLPTVNEMSKFEELAADYARGYSLSYLCEKYNAKKAFVENYIKRPAVQKLRIDRDKALREDLTNSDSLSLQRMLGRLADLVENPDPEVALKALKLAFPLYNLGLQTVNINQTKNIVNNTHANTQINMNNPAIVRENYLKLQNFIQQNEEQIP